MALEAEKLAGVLARLEALLFIHGEPMSFAKIGKSLGVGSGEAEELASELERRLGAADRGLALVRSGERIQLVTKSDFHGILEEFVKGELTEDLTPASLETLALVAYFGPIGRSEIEYHRGVNSSFILRSLLMRGLVERSADPKRPNSFLYAASFDLLRHLGITQAKELPEYEKFKTLFSAGGARLPDGQRSSSGGQQ